MRDPRETVIAWTPAWCTDSPDAGCVRVGPFPDTGREPFTAGAVYREVRGYSEPVMRHYLLSLALGMILRDGISPVAVHRAFSAFPEWIEAIPPDVPQASALRLTPR